MEKPEAIQSGVDTTWSQVWTDHQAGADARIFKHRLFVEGYAVVAKYLPTSPFSFLDVGCGGGRYGLAIARDNPTSEVTLSDRLAAACESVTATAEQLAINNTQIVQADAQKTPFADNTFDGVLADAVIQHIPDDLEAVREMARITKPNGVVIVSVVNSRNPFHSFYKGVVLRLLRKPYDYGFERTYTKKELHHVMQEAGLEVVAEDGFYTAYGLYRWGYTYPFFKVLARILNRVVTSIDRHTNRWISRHWGFEIVSVGKKI